MTVITNAAFEANPANPQAHSGAITPSVPINVPRPGVERQGPIGAAFSRENIVGSAHDEELFRNRLTELQSQADLDGPFDVGEHIPDRHVGKAELYVEGAIDKPTADWITARLDQQEDDERVLNESGAIGVVDRMIASVFDPTSLPVIPLSLIKNMGTAGKVALGAGTIGGSVAAQEAFLQNQQDNRTIQETNIAVTTGLLFGGFLGPLLTKNKALMDEALHEARAAARGQDKTFTVDGQKVTINQDSFKGEFTSMNCP